MAPWGRREVSALEDRRTQVVDALERLPIVVVIDNNGGLDCISQQQERLFANEQHFATDFSSGHPPRWPQLL